ncbi:MAG: anthranilate phosphoribosyltransferase [Methanobacteriota archaeon]|nr:MAG: anthranilate phosphoribosyltransferase [Euryarchaeota archaeon]
MIQEGIRLAVEGRDLSSDAASEIMEEMMSGSASPSQVASFLTAMRMKGETKDELLGFVRTMRSRAGKVRAPDGAVDMCGTGGDGVNTFNISTAASFVVAATGVPVAKHGNKAVSSRSGSADMLSAMGIPIDLGRDSVERCLHDTRIGFMFAPEFHKSMRNVMRTRREMGVRTFFNILGPMANPASVKRQLIGVYDPKVAPTMAEVLGELGAEHAMIVHGSGMDELTNLGPTEVTELREGNIVRYDLSPGEFSLDIAEPREIEGGSALDNARTTLSILRGEKSHRSDIVALNSAAALYVAGKVEDIHQGLSLARETIRDGSALTKLKEFHDASRRLESEAQREADISQLRGKRVQPEVLMERCSEISADLVDQITSTEGGPEAIGRLDPDIISNPTVLTVVTLNRLHKILTNPSELSKETVGKGGKLSEAISAASGIAVIGEYKPRSPSTSTLVVPPEVAETAEAYADSGVAGMSVLAEEDYFAGGATLFLEFRSKVAMPLLFKDFVTCEKQIEVAHDVGADAILLIAKALRAERIDDLVRASVSADIEPLVEVHDEIDLEKVTSCESYGLVDMIGINSRDLRTLDVNVERAIDIRKSIAEDKLVIAESGIRSPEDVRSLSGFDGVLIGSMFMNSPTIGRIVEEVTAVARSVVR